MRTTSKPYVTGFCLSALMWFADRLGLGAGAPVFALQLIPIVPKQLNWVLRALGPVAAAHVVGGA